jgi:serine/threonine protein kinase
LANRCPKCGRRGRACACHEALAPGTILAGRYLIVRTVGRGATATVYQALDRMLDEPVAVKVLDLPRSAFAAAERLRSEIKLARRVTHPNVCRIHDYGEDGERRFICMELIEGRNLREVLAERGRLPAAEACGVAAQAADALEAIHARGIVHRDVKTANLIQDAGGRVYLTDFGIATGGGPGSAGLAAGYVAGTPEYMSPEQAQGLRLDARSDLYALGVVLFEMLAGEAPFRGASTGETLVRQVQHPMPLAALEGAGVPPGLRALVERLLAKRRADRPGSAAEVAGVLRAFALTESRPMPSRGRPATTSVASQTVTLPLRRHGSLAAAAALVALLSAMAVGSKRMPAFRGPDRDVSPVRITGPLAAAPAAPPRRLTPPRPLDPSIPRAVATRPRDSGVLDVVETLPARAVARLLVPMEVGSRAGEPERPVTIADEGTAPVVEVPSTPALGHLRFGITPWAEVTVDGSPVGTTPLAPLPLRPGTYTARLLHPDFRPLLRKITIQPGQTTPLNVDLRLDGIRNR